MALTVEEVGGVTLVTVNFEQFDASNANIFKREITPVLQAQRKIVLDLGPVQYVDSQACGAIFSCVKYLSAERGELKICRVNEFVRNVFTMIRMHRVCDVLATREEAVGAFQKA